MSTAYGSDRNCLSFPSPVPPESSPSTNGSSNGRDPKTGRFMPGAPGGPGNPHVKRVGKLRTALLAAVTPGEMTKVIRAMLREAKTGDAVAARLICEYALGKPEGESVHVTTLIHNSSGPAPEARVADRNTQIGEWIDVIVDGRGAEPGHGPGGEGDVEPVHSPGADSAPEALPGSG